MMTKKLRGHLGGKKSHKIDYIVLCLRSVRPTYLAQVCPGIEPMLDHCVCLGFLLTLDDDLDQTFILPYGTFSSADALCLLISIN